MKKKIPKAIREQLWIEKIGKNFESKCKTTWCKNKINVFDFQAGHDIPACRGGSHDITNLIPICSRCNLSMGSQHTFKEWCNISKKDSKWISLLKSLSRIWPFSDTTVSGIKLIQSPTNQKNKQMK